MWGERQSKYLVCQQPCGVILIRQSCVCLQVDVGFKYSKMLQVFLCKFSPAFILLAGEADYVGVAKAGVSLCSENNQHSTTRSCCTELDALCCDVVKCDNPLKYLFCHTPVSQRAFSETQREGRDQMCGAAGVFLHTASAAFIVLGQISVQIQACSMGCASF